MCHWKISSKRYHFRISNAKIIIFQHSIHIRNLVKLYDKRGSDIIRKSLLNKVRIKKERHQSCTDSTDSTEIECLF